MGKFFATKGVVALNVNGVLKLKTAKGISKPIVELFPEVKVNDTLENDHTFREFLNSANLVITEKICSSNQCLGIIALGEKLNKIPYTEDDIEFLKTILNISATAIQNSLVVNELKRVNRVLDSRINRLSSLFELSKEFGGFSESTRVAKLLVYSVIGQFLVSKFAVITFEESDCLILECKFPEAELIKAINKYPNLRKVENSLVKKEIKQDYELLDKLNVELVVPMQLQGETKGLIILGQKNK